MGEARFGYFYGREAEQYAFFRIPKLMFTAEPFRMLSCEAKVLYGLMIDRMGLSMRNGWHDGEDRVYIIFKVEEITEILNCGTQKAVKVLKELDSETGIGLIEKKRPGLGRPNIIYVKNFMSGERGFPTGHGETAENADSDMKACRTGTGEAPVPHPSGARTGNRDDGNTGAVNTVSGEAVEIKPEEPGEPKYRNCENHDTELPETELRDCENQNAGIVKITNAECRKSNTNKTEYYNTKNNNTDSNNSNLINLINLINPGNPTVSGNLIRPAPERFRSGDRVSDALDTYREIIRENISYGCFADGRYGRREDVDELVELMADIMTLPDDAPVRIAGAERPAGTVKSRFMKLNFSHMEYVTECLRRNTGKVRNIKAYLLTTLYNAALTMGNYYQAEVNHDLYGSG